MSKIIVNDYDREVYEKELKNFLPESFIDIHTHLNKKEFEHYGDHNGGSSWTDLIAEELPIEEDNNTEVETNEESKEENTTE